MSEKTEVYTYKRIPYNSSYHRRPARKSGGIDLRGLPGSLAGVLSLEAVFAAVGAFLVGRAVLLGELIPFAGAYAAAVALTFGRRGILPVLFLSAGVATIESGYGLWSYVVLVLLSFMLAQAVPPRYAGRRPVMAALVFCVTICVKAGFSAFAGSTPYDYISIFFEGLFAAALTPACISFFATVRRLNGIMPLRPEEMVSFLVLLAGIIAGTGDLHLWYISAKGFLSRTIILLAAYVGGAGLGAAAGSVVGIIPGLAYTVTPYLVGAYSFSGLLAGLGGMVGKFGVALAFFASNIILLVYFNNFESMESVIAETGLACVVFMLLPEAMARGIASSVAGEAAAAKSDDSGEMLRESFRERLKDFSDIFREMAMGFGENTSIMEKKDNEQALKQIMEEISKKVCTDCGSRATCWEKEYFRTYRNMLDVFALAEVYKRVRVSDLPEELKLRCIRPRDLTVAAVCLYEVLKVDRQWRKKFVSGRSTVGDQLRGMAGVIEGLAGESRFSRDMAGQLDQALKQKLKQLGIPVKGIRTFEKGDRREMLITAKACRGELDCRYKIAPVVSELLGQVYAATGCFCEGNIEGLCKFRLYQSPCYSVAVGAARAGKDGSGVCGDTFEFFQLSDGKFAAVLSDGMGSGENAAMESGATVALLRRMLEAGIDFETAIKSVNSVQVLKDPEETFATIDMTVIDLYSGQAEFVKIAAPPTYLIRGGRPGFIRAGTLPVGILNDIDISVTEKRLNSGDVIVMVTDGVLESHRGGRDGQDWITGVLDELSGLEPMEMAELLMRLAQTGSGGEISVPDDMAVLVIRLEKEKVIEFPR
ncbi:MAG: stage II sporulation protein E [Bacillota bacterium]